MSSSHGTLRDAYDDAFRDWAGQVADLEVARGPGGSSGEVAEAEGKESNARQHYQDSRDRLVESMIHPETPERPTP